MSPAVESEPMRPSTAYQRGVKEGRWESDPSQAVAVEALDRIHDALLAHQHAGALSRLVRRWRDDAPIRGLYLWGSVGRGKTFLIDLFFAHLDLTAKRRMHFHRFMAEVHTRMTTLGEHADPLVQVAADFSREFRLLCLDEFFVTDIGDAMILGRLLDQLFARGVTLVTTSNTAPQNLYKYGLQRANFLPAIILLQAHCQVFEMAGEHDYRLRTLTHANVWQTPNDANAEDTLNRFFERLSNVSEAAQDTPTDVVINERAIPVRNVADGVVWFDFAALCEGPRSVADYIDIAQQFHTVMVSAVPRFDRLNEDAAYRFVMLVDELYDRGVKLIASAATTPVDLYHGRRVAHEFERSISRLIEMQSQEYLAREHLQ